MPLHLLGKKSWNVYNQDNVERVQRDEERARAEAQDGERKRREGEGADRLRLLRGDQDEPKLVHSNEHSSKRKRDTQDDEDELRRRSSKKYSHREDSSEQKSEHVTQNDLDSISNMRLRDAAGRTPGSQKPWYSNLPSDKPHPETGRNVWGNEDVGRQARDQQRVDASDPLLAMKRGVKQLRQVEKQKCEWRKERERDLNEVEELARREKHSRKVGKDDRHGRRDRSKDRDRVRHRHKSRHQERERDSERDRDK